MLHDLVRVRVRVRVSKGSGFRDRVGDWLGRELVWVRVQTGTWSCAECSRIGSLPQPVRTSRHSVHSAGVSSAE